MENLEEIYKKLTGVDISEQKKLWDERGKGYYGEFLAFCEVFLKVAGQCKIIMNLQLPTPTGKTTEIDLLLIHETGLYVFEVKHYKGTIYGNDLDSKWTQYFRTAPNQTFQNPIRQNAYHIDALRYHFPDIPIYSYVVFTSPECDLRIEHSGSNVIVCTLNDLERNLFILRERVFIINAERIDAIFRELMPLSPLTEEKVEYGGKEISFQVYINAIREVFLEAKKQLGDEFSEKKAREEKKRRKARIFAGIVCALSLAVSVFACARCYLYAQDKIQGAEKELAEFAKKFEHVEPYSGKINLKDGILTATNVKVEDSADVTNAASLSFALNWNGEHYGLRVTRESKIIVLLENGTVKEYDLLESVFPFKTKDLYMGKGNFIYSAYEERNVPRHELSGVQLSDISNIKLSGLDIWVTEDGGYKFVVVESGYELEVYNAEN